ncbi:hypothetical protein PAPHI01_2396 [Pancytospora philotis]|nr:hypothetical protein PAPHI01_2396 [Pancytospora philotis]
MFLATIYVLFVRSHLAKDDGAATAYGFTCTDYTEFGVPSRPGLNALEKQVLDPLCKFCMEYTSPEIPRALIDARMGVPSADDKSCCLVYAAARHYQQAILLQRLQADLGFASRQLLAKLLRADYLEHLRGASLAAINSDTLGFGSRGTDAHQAFVDLVDAPSSGLETAYDDMEARMNADCSLELKEYVVANEAASNSIDYALVTIARSKETTLNTPEFLRLFDYWLSDHDSFKRRYDVIRGYLKVLMLPESLIRHHQNLLRNALAQHVINKDRREYLDLYCSFRAPKGATISIVRLFENYDFEMFSPHFVLLCVGRVRRSGLPKSSRSVENIWRKYLQDAPTFLKKPSVLKERRELFKEIPHWFMREVFVFLDGCREDYPNGNKIMGDLMGMLDFDVFFHILKELDEYGEQDRLMHFMLFYLDCGKVEGYLEQLQSGYYLKSPERDVSLFALKLKQKMRVLINNRLGIAGTSSLSLD